MVVSAAVGLTILGATGDEAGDGVEDAENRPTKNQLLNHTKNQLLNQTKNGVDGAAGRGCAPGRGTARDTSRDNVRGASRDAASLGVARPPGGLKVPSHTRSPHSTPPRCTPTTPHPAPLRNLPPTSNSIELTTRTRPPHVRPI